MGCNVKAARSFVRDGAGQFTRSYDTVLEGSGITAIRTPPRSPQANAFAERWVRTLRHELLDRTIIWNERQLRQLLNEYIEHFNTHRPHRGIRQRAPNNTGDVVPIRANQPIERTSTCALLINEYRPEPEPTTQNYKTPKGPNPTRPQTPRHDTTHSKRGRENMRHLQAWLQLFADLYAQCHDSTTSDKERLSRECVHARCSTTTPSD
jgi:hypothetical protein